MTRVQHFRGVSSITRFKQFHRTNSICSSGVPPIFQGDLQVITYFLWPARPPVVWAPANESLPSTATPWLPSAHPPPWRWDDGIYIQDMLHEAPQKKAPQNVKNKNVVFTKVQGCSLQPPWHKKAKKRSHKNRTTWIYGCTELYPNPRDLWIRFRTEPQVRYSRTRRAGTDK